MSFRRKILPAAAADIEEVLDWSETWFGDIARFRYARLIHTAIDDLADNPTRVASRVRPEFGWGMRSWHLRLSRERARTPTGIVNDPRHLVFFRVESGVVVIEHILHDSRDVGRHFAK